jgi:hypothetical protein
MNFLRHSGQALERALARWWACLDTPHALLGTALLLPVLFGLVSLSYGQDFNWDLLNYHYYTPYALLNGKVGYDLAPGQWQSYFNPTLDLLYYGLQQACPPRVAGFLMGWLHGLNAVLVLAIARRVLPAASHRVAAVLLALGGCLQPGFLSLVGNSMGDNMAALFVLGALLLLLRGWPDLLQGGAQGARVAVLAGLVMGLGTGLKLTNAIHALAMCLAMLVLPQPSWRRLWQPAVFGLAVLGGIAVSAGHWYWRMWQLFGNPLFPQFNNYFKAPLAAPLGIGDTSWLPQGWAEKLFWPFFFWLRPNGVSEIAFSLLIWPVLYVLAFAVVWVKARQAVLGQRVTAPLRGEVRFLFAFVALAYVLWIHLFSIYRYLIPLELLAPLLLWLLLEALAPKVAWLRGPVVVAVALAGLPPGNWGHAGWSEKAFQVELPAIASPKESLVFTVHGDPPMSWLIPSFPKELAFVSLGSGFPESDAYGERVAAMLAARKGPYYVMIHTSIRSGPRHFWPRLVLGRYGLRMEAGACVDYAAAVGKNEYNYMLCPVYLQSAELNRFQSH